MFFDTSDGRSVRRHTDSHVVFFSSQESCAVGEVLVNQQAMKAYTILLQCCSNVWSVTGRRQCNPKRIDMHANSDTDDSLGVKEYASYVTRDRKKKIFGLDIFITVQFDLKSVCVYNNLLF